MASIGVSRTYRVKDCSAPSAGSQSPASTTTDEAWATLIRTVDGFISLQDSLPTTTSRVRAQTAVSPETSGVSYTQLVDCMRMLRMSGMVEVIQAYVLKALARNVAGTVAPHFWRLLAPSGTSRRDQQDRKGSEASLHENEGSGDGAEILCSNGDEIGEPLGSSSRRASYGRVREALLYVSREVEGHQTLVCMLDNALAEAASSPTSGASAGVGNVVYLQTPSLAQQSLEARYRCAFTAQVMASAPGGFHDIMRAFFDRNLRFWHRCWKEERRRRRRAGQGHQSQEDFNAGRTDEDADMDVGPDSHGADEQTAAGAAAAATDASITSEGSRGDGATMHVEESDMDNGPDGEDGSEEDGMGEEDEEEDEEEGEEDDEEEDEEDEEDSEGDDFSDVNTKELLQLWGVLRRLGWFSLLQDAFTSVMLSHVLAYVRNRCDGVYDTPVLDHVMVWKDEVLLRWIALLLHDQGEDGVDPGMSDDSPGRPGVTTRSPAARGSVSFAKDASVAASEDGMAHAGSGPGILQTTGNREDSAHGWAQRLGLAVHEAFCSARMSELFDIIADYPDSALAIGELKTALGVTQQHQRLAVLLRESVRRRLLHPGANTHQIIDVYIATIKVLRILDPKDILLETVAGPIRRYLRARKDTVRCIVASLTDEASGDLYEELRRQDARPLDGDDASDEDDDGPVAPDWEPASRDADPTSGNRSGGDILSMLVSIYGSKELFVTEYRLMLADKLVNNLSYTTDREVQNLELLKLRFGESSMRQCEIMVRDVEESKRVNANVHELQAQQRGDRSNAQDSCLDAVMVSQHFWPQLQGEDVRLHPSMQKRLAEFSKAYSVIKNPRLLVWKKQLGVVQLTLEFGGVERSFSVSPLHATLIMHFQGSAETWQLADLAEAVALLPGVVQKKMMLWVNQGVVTESAGSVYRLMKDQAQSRSGGDGGDTMAMEDNTEAAVSAGTNDAESDKVIEQFLIGMLTNLGKLPLNRIHNSLKMFMASGENKYDKSLPELQQLLWRLSAEGKLEQVDGEYRLVKQ